MTRAAVYQITIDGQDVSSNFNPVLISLGVDLYDGGQADTVEIELDDSGGQIALPRVGASISVSLGWSDTGAVPIFDGFTDEPRSTARHRSVRRGGQLEEGASASTMTSAGGRSRGRVLTLSGKSVDLGGKPKQPQQGQMDNASFASVAQQWGQKAGLDVSISGSLGAIQRPYWSIGNESFMAWGVRIARELGATFKILGTHAVFLPLSGGASASGAALEGISATWGVNLIDWSITPVQSRPVFSSFRARWYDPVAAQWKSGTASGSSGAIGSDTAAAAHTARFKAPTQADADVQAAANAAAAATARGSGDHVEIDGEPTAQPEAPCTVSGIRPGVDGSYTISRVRHDLRRGQGFTTTLGLKQPSGDAGTDSRSSGSGGSGDSPSGGNADQTPVTTPSGSGGIGSA